jgi:tetratricopeptide (TPR) repeat protein
MNNFRLAFRIEDSWTVTANSGELPINQRDESRMFITLGETTPILANPVAAEMRARDILSTNTHDPVARYLLGAALSQQSRYQAARAVLEPLAISQPQMAPVWRELGFVLEKLGEGDPVAALMKALDFNYMDTDVLFALGRLLPLQYPAQFHRATTLLAQRKFAEALTRIDELLEMTPADALVRTLKAIALAGNDQIEASIAEFERFIEDRPDKPGLWLQYGRLLRSKRDGNAAAAMRRAMQILPSFVDAYVTYASIKPFRWDDFMIGQVHAQLARPDLAPEHRAQLCFALGKAYEDMRDFRKSFEHYRACNDILDRGSAKRAAKASANFVRRTATIFGPALFRRHPLSGHPAPDPIFIVGMKRAGSTLVEQILSRHSMIEPLGELEELTGILSRLRGYPQVLRELPPDRFRAMGEEYLKLVRHRRKLDKPFFTDKLPHNFGRTGLIRLILPNAKIIDVRRNPLDCGLSCYKHYFPGGQISLNLRYFASGYRDYVKLMAHFDRVLPGKIHRVIYERLIGNLEHEVRRLLDYLGLPFEEECLRFHEETRNVFTPSVDQVRTPLYNTAVEYWRHYEPWLGPMKEELGYVLAAYPEVPRFYEEVHFNMRNPRQLGETSHQYNVVRGLRQSRIELA